MSNVCIFTCKYVCIHVDKHAWMSAGRKAQVSICLYVCISHAWVSTDAARYAKMYAIVETHPEVSIYGMHICMSSFTHIYVCSHVFGHACTYKCRHLGRYVFRHTVVFICMYVLVYICMHACMYVYQVSTPMSLCTYLMTLNKYDCHITNMSHKAIMLYGDIDPTFLNTSATTQPTAMSTLQIIAMYGLATHMPLNMPHTQISECTPVKQPCQYKYLTWTCCNQWCDQEHWYTYVSHYWHMPLNKLACDIVLIWSTALLI